MSLEAQNEALIRRCPCTVLSSVFIPPFIISFLNTVLYLSLCLASSTPPMSFSHSLCPCRTIALVVGGASWNLPPPQLGLCTKTSFLSSNTKLFTDSLPSAEHLGATCYKKKKDLMSLWHTSAFSHEKMLRLHTAPDDALTLCDWLQISNETRGRVEQEVLTDFCVLTCPQRSQLKGVPVTACLSNILPKCTSLWNTLLNNDALRQKAHHHSPSPEQPPPPVSALLNHYVGNSTVAPWIICLICKPNWSLLYLPVSSQNPMDQRETRICMLNGILSPINTGAWLCFWKGCFVPMVGLYWYQGANQTQR